MIDDLKMLCQTMMVPDTFVPAFSFCRLVRATAPSQRKAIKSALEGPTTRSWTHRLTGLSPSNSAHGMSLTQNVNTIYGRSLHKRCNETLYLKLTGNRSSAAGGKTTSKGRTNSCFFNETQLMTRVMRNRLRGDYVKYR